MFFKKQKPKEQEPINREPTNQFYETLKKKVDMAVSGLFARMDELRKQINKAEQKLSHEIDMAENYNKRRVKLKEVCGERIMDGHVSYEKYNVEMRKLRLKTEVSEEICQALKDEFIPKLKADYDKVHIEFMEALNDAAKTLRWFGVDTCQVEADKAMKHFEALVSSQLNYTSAWSRIYDEYEEKFLEMYGASYTLPAILPRSITSENIVYVQKLLEPERALLNQPLQARPVEPEPIVETPIEPEPIEPPVVEKPAETSVEKEPVESLPKYKRECEKCLADFQTTEPDVVFCEKCIEIEVKRLELVEAESDSSPQRQDEANNG